MPEKLDHKRTVPGYRARRGMVEELTLPPLSYLMIDGVGDPNTSAAYADALATLFPVAYALKVHSTRELGRDYTVMPLEALWWAEDMAVFTDARDKSSWSWTAMILTPPWLSATEVATAAAAVARKGRGPALDLLRLETLEEGAVVQTLHLGPYDEEGPVLEDLHDHIAQRGLRLTGRHHEIYLGDARRVAPERLRTILRQPVAPA